MVCKIVVLKNEKFALSFELDNSTFAIEMYKSHQQLVSKQEANNPIAKFIISVAKAAKWSVENAHKLVERFRDGSYGYLKSGIFFTFPS